MRSRLSHFDNQINPRGMCAVVAAILALSAVAGYGQTPQPSNVNTPFVVLGYNEPGMH